MILTENNRQFVSLQSLKTPAAHWFEVSKPLVDIARRRSASAISKSHRISPPLAVRFFAAMLSRHNLVFRWPASV